MRWYCVSGCVGCVPAAKSSQRVRGHSGDGSIPLGAQICTSARPSGRAKESGATRCASRMMSCQTGPAPSTPLTPAMGELSALPTHTPTSRSDE